MGVTGSSGYLGSCVVRELTARGHAVVRLSRAGGAAVRGFDLGEPLAEGLLDGIDALVHCAWDFRPSSWKRIFETNVAGSLRLFEKAVEQGVSRIVFISSLSSYDGCRSLYGRAKLEVEKEAERLGVVVIRPGLIYGPRPGGMVRAISNAVRRLPVLPLVGRGDATQYLVHQQDLCALIAAVIRREPGEVPSPLIAAALPGRSSRSIVEEIAASFGKRRALVPVPWRLIHAALRLIETFGLRPRTKADSVIGLVHPGPEPTIDGSERLGVRFRRFDAADLAGKE